MFNNNKAVSGHTKNGHEELYDAYQRFIDSVKDVLTDFTTIEVNSILASNISADHPLTDREFLSQISDDLMDWCRDNIPDERVQRPLDHDALEQLRGFGKKESPLTEAEHATMQAIGQEVEACLKHQSDRMSEVDSYVRAEYRRHLRYMQKYMDLCRSANWHGDTLHGRDRQQLRKLWEMVDTTFVYAQTVMGLDGDVISRVNEQLFQTAQKIATQNIEGLMHFHGKSTEAAANCRNSLVATIVEIIRTVVRR